MKKYSLLFLVVLLAVAVHSCRYDNVEPKKASLCDTTVHYLTTIQPLINAQCVPCHSGPTPSGSVDFSTYATVSSKALSIKIRVVTIGDMPQAGSGFTLTAAERQEFACWIEQGALNN